MGIGAAGFNWPQGQAVLQAFQHKVSTAFQKAYRTNRGYGTVAALDDRYFELPRQVRGETRRMVGRHVLRDEHGHAQWVKVSEYFRQHIRTTGGNTDDEQFDLRFAG